MFLSGNRLVKEMRLKGIKTIQEANIFLQEYLPKHNKRFAVEAMEGEDIHREIPMGLDIDSILCIKTERVLRNDFTAAHNKKLYQIEDNIRTKEVTVEERLDGRMLIPSCNQNDTIIMMSFPQSLSGNLVLRKTYPR